MVEAVVVTGGAGFIGSHTVEALASSGAIERVVVLDSLYSGSLENLKRVSRRRAVLVRLDISMHARRLVEEVRGAAGNLRVSGVVHLAAVVGVDEAWADPRRALETNVAGTLNVLELARVLDAERFVYASSAAVYGEPKYTPIDEMHPLEPSSLYGETKLAGEKLVWAYARRYDIKPIALRYFNVYGPRMRDGTYAGVIYRFLKALLRGERPVVYGDGNQTRDFVYVEDVARANLMALQKRYVGAVNIASGRETSIRELYGIVCRLLGRFVAPEHRSPRGEDVRRSAASIRSAESALGWKPLTSLESGLRKTVEYYAR
uniref:NAD-dependent epimerase/dehydratase family protein n=1 Tax=Fervidicoccus fontis TaxID=683846 RepID=A0A7J3ZIX6_9CREN